MIVITYLTPQQNRGSVEPKVAVQYSRPYFSRPNVKEKIAVWLRETSRLPSRLFDTSYLTHSVEYLCIYYLTFRGAMSSNPEKRIKVTPSLTEPLYRYAVYNYLKELKFALKIPANPTQYYHE